MPILLVVAVIGVFQLGICFWMMTLLKSVRKLNARPFWQAIQKSVADSLHHPHPESRELDQLLEQLESLTIDKMGTARLKTLLQEKADDPNQPVEEQQRALFLLYVMPMVVNEQALADAADK